MALATQEEKPVTFISQGSDKEDNTNKKNGDDDDEKSESEMLNEQAEE